jgi:hypothetical protein
MGNKFSKQRKKKKHVPPVIVTDGVSVVGGAPTVSPLSDLDVHIDLHPSVDVQAEDLCKKGDHFFALYEYRDAIDWYTKAIGA